ncbi:DegV family protein [Thermotalea metallivorans]|uniref:DegV domain-containing protein n=1 Tax=Thermotalea metallivorans TaxID=520762 RepID=A0A140LEB7_9FIRM|nr:DegV family protein [Thermotalea metallivorans]KXG78892.1 DegV domain-containing protein [Thermotalea metallivorans]
MIKIVTDSVSDIPQDLAKTLDITVVPLTVNFEDKSYRDGIDLSTEEFFAMMKESPKLPTTSQVTPGEFFKVFQELTTSGNTVITILMSSQLSGTYRSALAAKDMLENGDIEIIDSKGVTLGYGLFVIEAARMAQNHYSKEEILKRITYMRENMEYKFVVDTLENLYKGGRLNAAEAFVGKLLNIKPILTMKDGKLIPEDKVRGRKKAIKWLIDWIQEHQIDLSQQTIGVNHSNDEAYALELIEAIRGNFAVKEIILSKTGCVVGTHAGPGAVAMYFLREYKQ